MLCGFAIATLSICCWKPRPSQEWPDRHIFRGESNKKNCTALADPALWVQEIPMQVATRSITLCPWGGARGCLSILHRTALGQTTSLFVKNAAGHLCCAWTPSVLPRPLARTFTPPGASYSAYSTSYSAPARCEATWASDGHSLHFSLSHRQFPLNSLPPRQRYQESRQSQHVVGDPSAEVLLHETLVPSSSCYPACYSACYSACSLFPKSVTAHDLNPTTLPIALFITAS
jgi:hypothetical protein